MMKHIETIELDSSQASITFSSIPQDYDDLKIIISARSDRSNRVGDDINLSFNSATTNFSEITLFGNGSSTGSYSASNGSVQFAIGAPAGSSTSNTFGNATVYISNYTANQAKSISIDAVRENNATEAVQKITAALWDDTAAITGITLTPEIGPNMVADSTASLYGITAGGDGTVTTS